MINNNTNPLHVLLLGKTPPPVGGVTVSVLNLKKSLEKKGIKVTVFYKDIKLPKCDLVHVNYSKPLFRFFGIVLGKMLSKKVIFTIHGNSIKQNSIFNRLSIKICDGIIILNRTILKNNLEFLKMVHSKVKLLPPIYKEGIVHIKQYEKYFLELKTDYIYILIYAFDRKLIKQNDIYGIDFILHNLSKFDMKYKFVFVDPKNKYNKIVRRLETRILHINRPINFQSLLQEVDIYLRPTITDGNSIAVLEALAMGTSVYASDCVDRPPGAITFKTGNIDDLLSKLNKYKKTCNKSNLVSIDEYINYISSI